MVDWVEQGAGDPAALGCDPTQEQHQLLCRETTPCLLTERVLGSWPSAQQPPRASLTLLLEDEVLNPAETGSCLLSLSSSLSAVVQSPWILASSVGVTMVSTCFSHQTLTSCPCGVVLFSSGHRCPCWVTDAPAGCSGLSFCLLTSCSCLLSVPFASLPLAFHIGFLSA